MAAKRGKRGKAEAGKHPTVVDIAARAGVAPMTVSRVINESGYVSEAMREKVMRVVKELNYHPNGLARSLKRQSTQVVGILLPDIVNPFSAELVRGIQEVLLSRGYASFICTSERSIEREQAGLRALFDHRVDGIVVATRETPTGNDWLRSLVERNLPVVMVGREFPHPLVGRVTAEQAAAMAGLDVKQALDWCQYDTKYAKAGTALPSTDILFFSVQQGQNDTLINDNTATYQKSAMDTNMVQASQLERGQLLIIESIQCSVTTPGNFDLTLQGSGNTTLPATLPTSGVTTAATAGVIASNLERAILRGAVGKLKIGTNFFESGPLMQFPSEFGISVGGTSVFTGTAQAGIIVPTDLVANNGFGHPRYLRFPRIIEAGQNFSWVVNFVNAFTPSRAFDIQVILRGLLFRDVS